jgi:hypothetical protein
MLAQRLDVQRNRFGDEPLDLVVGVASRHAARKVGHIRAPGLAFLLDDHDVLSHDSAFPTDRLACRQIDPSVPFGTSALGLPATVTVPRRSG